MRKTEIRPWTAEWGKKYVEEEKRLKEVFKEELLNIYHIGSTSVPTIGYAKPIIDILIVVKNIEKVNLYNEKMSLIGYHPRGEHGIAHRRYFTKGGDNRSHHVHMFQAGNTNIQAHLSFKEYLLNHPAAAKSYGELKLRLAEEFPDDTHHYQAAKEELVTELVKMAICWSISKNK